MNNLLRACLYNLDPTASEELHQHITGLNFVRVIAEVSTPEDLASRLQDGSANLVFFHLDPSPELVVDVIDQVSTRLPDLAMIAIGHETHPEAILAPMRAGCDQFVCEPIDHADLAAAVARVASKRLLNDTQSKCICVTGAAGGVGTTSIAANLAMEIGSLTDRPCALIDMNFQFGNLALNFDCAPRFTFHDLATSGAELDRSILVSSLTELPCKVALLARPEQVQQNSALSPEIVHRIVEVLRNTYESIVIDIPVCVDRQTLAAFSQADMILIVCQLSVPQIRNAKRYMDALVQSGVDEERIHVVMNRCGKEKGRISISDIETAMKKPVLARIPSDYEFVARSIDFGQPIATGERNNPVRTAIRDMAKTIVGDPSAAEETKKSARRGIFGRIRA